MVAFLSSWWQTFSRVRQGIRMLSAPGNSASSRPHIPGASSHNTPILGLLLECGVIVGSCLFGSRILKRLLHPPQDEEQRIRSQIEQRCRSRQMVRISALKVPINLIAMSTMVALRLTIKGIVYSITFAKRFVHLALKQGNRYK